MLFPSSLIENHISVEFNYTFFVLILQPAPYRKNCAREKEQHGDQKKYTIFSFIIFTHINNILMYKISYICGNTPEPVFCFSRSIISSPVCSFFNSISYCAYTPILSFSFFLPFFYNIM